jgi:uncharacterized protein YbaP (TraB family)
MLARLLGQHKLFNNSLSPLFKISNGNLNDISNNNLNENVSYIFGSCHGIKLDYLKDNEHIYTTLMNQHTLITECGRGPFINYQDTNKLNELIGKLNKSTFYDNLQSVIEYTDYINNTSNRLTNHIKSKYTPSIIKFLESDPICKLKHIDTMKFNYIAKHIYMTICLAGMDMSLISHYNNLHHPILELDSFGYCMNKFLDCYLIFSIFSLLISSKFTGKNIESLLDPTLFEYIDKPFILNNNNISTLMKPISSVVLVKRNIQWMRRIKKFHAEMYNPLFVFGCSHLHGNYGIIKLLQNEGFKVEQYHTGYNEYRIV